MKKSERRWSVVPAVRTLQEELPPGHCPFCERKIRRKKLAGRIPFICFRADCQTALNTEWVRWKRLLKATMKRTQRGTPRKQLSPRIESMYEGTEE